MSMNREEAIEILSDMRAEYNLFGDEEEAIRYHVLSMAIQEMNAIQAGQKHGRWVDATKEIGWPVWKCSVCGGNGRGDYFVCPWCGAKMRGEEDETD